MNKEEKKRLLNTIMARNGNVNPTWVDYIDGCFDSKIEELKNKMKEIRAEKRTVLKDYVRQEMQKRLS